MTERKPQGQSFTSWIDQQITEAAERGAFDDPALPARSSPDFGPDPARGRVATR